MMGEAMPQPHNLQHIAAAVMNEPLLMEPAYARVFFCSIAGALGASNLVDSMTGVRLAPKPAAPEMSVFDVPARDGPGRFYNVQNRIAVIPVTGALISRSMCSWSWLTGYDGILFRLKQAIADPGVDGVLLDMDTPGGMVSGAFDCADMIARLREEKPVWALANDMNCSAGQLIASSCSRRLVTQTARTGSIGVMMAHANRSAQLEQIGLEITLLYSGKHKVDGNPWSKLEPAVREQFQARMDSTRQLFAEKVSGYTGLSVQAVLDTEAQVYEGREALNAGLADELVINSDAISVMRDALNKNAQSITGAAMTTATNQPQAAVQQAAAPAATTNIQPAAAAIEQVDIGAQVNAAVVAENQRIMGILNCEAAQGREAQAKVLAGTPGMTVETATAILAAGAQSVQVRTETALDTLMETQSPDPARASVEQGSGDADFDKLMAKTPFEI